MCTIRRLAWCATIGGAVFLVASSARAQDDLFGSDGSAAQPAAVPAAAVPDALDNEQPTIVANDADSSEGNQDFCRCIGESDSAAVRRIESALDGKLAPTGLDFTETPLEEVVTLLQEEYGIPIQIDVASLEATGLGVTEKVTVNIHNVSLRSALRLMLKKLQLTYIIQDEVLLITTPEEAESQLSTCVYNVRGFLDDTSDKSMDALIDTIASCVSTETWAENGGGESEIRALKPGLLVISQTQAVHDQISSLLKSIRDMRSAAPTAAVSMNVKPQVVTRGYELQIDQEGDGKELRSQVRDLVMQSLPNEQWDGKLADGQSVMLAVLDNRVIVRHTSSVQDAVQSLLVDSGLAEPSLFHGSKQRRAAARRGAGSASDAEQGAADDRASERGGK